MHLGGPTTERGRGLEVTADRAAGRLGDRLPGQIDQGSALGLGERTLGASIRLLVVSGQFAEGVFPAGPLIGDEPLENPQHQGLGPLSLVDQGPGGLRDPVELGLLGEEPADLEVGVDARLEASKDLEDQAIAEEDRRVALLERASGDRQRFADGPACRLEGRGPGRPDRARVRRDRTLARHGLQEMRAQRGLGQRIEGQAETFDPPDDPPGCLTFEMIGRRPGGHPNREEVGLGRARGIGHLD